MLLADLLFALVISFLLALVFGLGLRRPGPWGGFFWFFLLLFFATWALAAWVTPVGPVAYGVAWVPVAVGGLLVAMILAAAGPPRAMESSPGEGPSEAAVSVTVGVLFWAAIVLLALAAAAAYAWPG